MFHLDFTRSFLPAAYILLFSLVDIEKVQFENEWRIFEIRGTSWGLLVKRLQKWFLFLWAVLLCIITNDSILYEYDTAFDHWYSWKYFLVFQNFFLHFLWGYIFIVCRYALYRNLGVIYNTSNIWKFGNFDKSCFGVHSLMSSIWELNVVQTFTQRIDNPMNYQAARSFRNPMDVCCWWQIISFCEKSQTRQNL